MIWKRLKIEDLRSYSDNVIDENDITNWPRIIATPNKLKRNVKLTVCSTEGNVETWQVPKSLGKQTYHDARKSQLGDSWALGKKTRTIKNQIPEAVKDKLDVLYKTSKRHLKRNNKENVGRKKLVLVLKSLKMGFRYRVMASQLELSKKYKQQARQAQFEEDPSKLDGN